MPHIKKIELKGFKTFGGKKPTTISLDKGLTVFTGPNGSGKTNVVDAILFVLGELSSKRLRADNFSRLIFHGAPNTGLEKAKLAKVVVQFDNSDSRIPVETLTVTISREVYRNGQSVYRINGRRISRTNFVDILSVANISSTGHNVVLQGTITRMAEVSANERRRIIEDLVGIGQYDAEKSEAEEKLRMAEISIRTAMGRIDEVQKRIDDLERERNDILRHNFIQNEIQRFEATKTSHDLLVTEEEIKDVSLKAEKIGTKVEKLRQIRDDLRSQRRGIETEWRKLSTELTGVGGTKVFEVQVRIGEVNSKLTELTTKIESGTTSLESLKKVKENSVQQLETIKNEIAEDRKKIRDLRRLIKLVSNETSAKQSQYEFLSKEISSLWADLGENGQKTRETEQHLDELYQSLVTLKSDNALSKTRVKVLSRRINELNSRKKMFELNLSELQKSLSDLQELQKDQKNRLKNLNDSLDRRVLQKESIEREIVEAGRIADSAREAVVEFATQRELAEAVESEVSALRNIEELVELSVISGVYGRLRKLIKTEKEYKQAVEAAASGWLDSMVVRDLDSAFTCAETLKRLKLGRIKIIPLKEISEKNALHAEESKIRKDSVLMHVDCAKRYKPAIAFVFGDTIVAKDDKEALISSYKGRRTVTINGDLYEAGGGMESGFYRAPIDFSKIIPSENAVNSLDQAVKALQGHLSKRGGDITTFEEEIGVSRVAIAKLSEAIVALEREVKRVHRRERAIIRNTKRIDERIKGIQELLEKEKTKIGIQRAQKRNLQKKTNKLKTELNALREMTDPTKIQEMEINRVKLSEEIEELRKKLGNANTELSTLSSELENVLEPAQNNVKIQLKKLNKQLFCTEEDIQQAFQQRRENEEELSKLETSKEELSRSILNAKEDSKEFTFKIDNIDKQLHHLDNEHEQAEHLFNQLKLTLQTLKLQLTQNRHRLQELGYEEPLKILPEQVQAAESSLKLMRFELERLGAVNQLALTHYAEQISRYKELSIRMNDLEKEKLAIISFMNEIDGKKRSVFMEAFERINGNFTRFFSKLTGGGGAHLQIENPNEPFNSGVEMIVQFPNKAPIIVTGASSGERSVATVAFLISIQDFLPAAFYLFDEIDAHLDAFHVEKLGELLVEESTKSQFIIITLKPEMINQAEKICGVYERNGVSYVVTTKLKGAA